MDKLQQYKSKLPNELTVVTQKTEDGFFAEISELPNCFTQAETFAELIDMVNDAVFTYLDIPEDIREQLGTVYLPEKFSNEIKRAQIQEACRDLVKELQPSSSLFRKLSFT